MTHIEDNIDLNEVFNIGRTNGGYDRHSRSASIATSKASQQKSRTSTASSQSTLRPSTPPPQPAARSTAPPEPNLYVPHEPTEDTSSLMEKVFSSVHLEPVLYSGRGERYDAYDAPPPPQPRQQAPAPPPPQQAHNEEHHQVLEDFDKILGSGTGTSLRSSKAASRRSTFTQEDRRSSHYEVTASVVAHKLEEHNSNHYEEHHDETDSFNNGFGTPQLPGARVEKDGGFRNRTQTMDSLASLAESRFGDFDVQDDSGHFKGSTINIFHNDVAYQRPKQKKAKGPPVPAANLAASVAEEARVRRVQEQARAAQAHQALLEQQVRREQEEVRRLQQRTDQAERELGRSSGVRSPHTGVTVGDFIGRINRSNSESTTRASTDSTNIYEEEQVTVSEIAARQHAYGTEVQVAGKTHLIIPQKHEIPNFSVNPNIHKVIVGGEQQVSDEDKTILLFGPEGSGKSAAINSIANYLYDVKKENDFRFVVEDPSYHPTAPSLTAYQFNNTILGFAVTVVDTAGVKNEKGYKTTSELIKTWFEQELVDAGKFKLDAISIVLRHDEDNLGWPFIYELAAVKKLFGDDLKTNVLPIITHSEVLPQPVAIRSLALANVAFVEYYKVNNSGFFPPPAGSNRLQHNLYFSHGIASLERLFRDLQELIHPLLAILKQHNSLVNKPTLRSPTSPTGHH